MAYEFPLYLMTEDGKSKFMPLRQAGALADSMFSRVEIGKLVLESDFSVRKITDREHSQIVEIADRHSDSK
jgi:hypothetical protein